MQVSHAMPLLRARCLHNTGHSYAMILMNKKSIYIQIHIYLCQRNRCEVKLGEEKLALEESRCARDGVKHLILIISLKFSKKHTYHYLVPLRWP